MKVCKKQKSSSSLLLMRSILPVLLIGSAILSGCSSGRYRDDVETGVLARRCAEAIGMQGAEFGTWEDLGASFDSSADEPDLTVCRAGDGGNLDEFGIWKVGSGNARAAASLLGDYLRQSYEDNRAYYDSYIPQETPKLRDAEVRIFGSYVAFAVLSPENRSLFFQTVERELTL